MRLKFLIYRSIWDYEIFFFFEFDLFYLVIILLLKEILGFDDFNSGFYIVFNELRY